MPTKFTITKPSVWMYKTEDLCGEVSDELLFGTVLGVISENDTCAYCKTDYGYYGYINKWELCDCETEDCGDSEKQFIYADTDVLITPEYKYAPYMSLSKGSRVKIISRTDNRFSECLIGKKTYYISNHALSEPQSENFAAAFVSAATGYIGTPYRWGGKSTHGIDCSGLAFMSAYLCGKKLYRDALPKNEYVVTVEEKDATVGDLIYFRGHVAIIGPYDTVIHASARAGCVVRVKFEESGLLRKDIVCYARIK